MTPLNHDDTHLLSDVESVQLLGSVQPSINTSANSNALAEKAVVEAFRTGREGGVPEPERFDERMFAGLYSKVDKRGDGQTEGTPESPLSVGTKCH